jgi:hypothetical protein
MKMMFLSLQKLIGWHLILAKTDWFAPKCEMQIGEALKLLSALNQVHELSLLD